jgi:hypothetical protein
MNCSTTLVSDEQEIVDSYNSHFMLLLLPKSPLGMLWQEWIALNYF